MKRTARRSLCPISFGLDIFGDRWSLLILRDILFYGRFRYSDFASSPEGMATNILADRLDRLVRAGILKKRRDPELGNQYLYSATKKGEDLLPVLAAMVIWGVRHDRKRGAGTAFAARARREPEVLYADILKAVRGGVFTDLRDKGRLPPLSA